MPAAVQVVALALLLTLTGSAVSQGVPACTLQLGSSQVQFDHCQPVDGIGSGFNLLWTLLPAGSGGAQAALWGMNSSQHGYVAFGFPPDPEPPTGAMVGGTVLSLQSCSSCPTGAELVQWFLGGTSSGEMSRSTWLQVSNITATALPAGGMAASFTLVLPDGTDPADVDFIFAAGAVYQDGGMRKHGTYGEAAFDLTTGTVTEPESSSMSVSAMVAAHIWLMLIGWGFFIPIGIVVARCLKDLDPLWFHVHRVLQSLGFIMGVIGLALGFAVAGGWDGRFPVHRNLGLAATILGFMQVIAVIPRLRPTLTSKYRRAWNQWHWWQGRAATVLSVANIFYGMINMEHLGAGAWGAYTAVFSLICVTAILLDGYQYVQLPPPGPRSKKVHGSEIGLSAKDGASLPCGITPGGTTPGDTTPAGTHGSMAQLVPQ